MFQRDTRITTSVTPKKGLQSVFSPLYYFAMILEFLQVSIFHLSRNSTISSSFLMLCDPNAVSFFHCPLLVITSNSFVVDFHYPLPIITQCCSTIVGVDPKGKKLVDEDVIAYCRTSHPENASVQKKEL
jgi:hypothetical protein